MVPSRVLGVPGPCGPFPVQGGCFRRTGATGPVDAPAGGQERRGARRSVFPGTDPMLRVLQTVWAAPPVTPKDLPDIMRTKPMAAGFWFDGKVLKGAALMPLAPGERAAVEKVIQEKLGDSPVVDTVAGIEFRKIESPRSKAKFPWIRSCGV